MVQKHIHSKFAPTSAVNQRPYLPISDQYGSLQISAMLVKKICVEIHCNIILHKKYPLKGKHLEIKSKMLF